MTRPHLTQGQQIVVVFLIQFSIFLIVSQLRLVDGDEGFYLMTSRLVIEGKLPYHDFLLTQMPLIPYVFGAWMRLAGMTWISARLLSAILTAALGTVLCNEVRRQAGRVAPCLLAALLFVSSTLVFAWFTVVKTYALSTLLLFLAYCVVIRCSATSTWIWLAAGLLLGASVDTRLYFAGLLPVFLWWIYTSVKTGARVAALLHFLGGCALAVMPNLYLLARDPRSYYFGNLGFHAVRSNYGFIGDFGFKIGILAQLFLGRGDGNGVQFSLLMFFILLLAIGSGVVTRTARLALTLGLVLGFICLLPTPPFVQYFCATIPFFILFATCTLSSALDALKDGPAKRYLLALYCAMLLAFVGSAIPDYRRFLVTGVEVIGIGPQRAPNYRISAIAAVSRAIDEQCRPAERVMSLWPGYIFQSKAEPYAGLENNSATNFADRLSPADLARYHILSPRGIEADIAARGPRLVVIGNQESMLVSREPFEKMLAGSGYRVAREIGLTRFWSADSPSGSGVPHIRAVANLGGR